MADPLWIAAHQAEELYGIPAATVRSWARRRRLFARALDGAGQPLYATAEILRLRSPGRNDVRPELGKQAA